MNSDGGLVLSNDTGADIIVANADNTGLTNGTYDGYVALTSADGEAIELGLGTNGTAADLQSLGFNESTGSDSIKSAAVTNTAITAATDAIQINGVDLGDVTGTSAADKAFAINAISEQTGVTASATTVVKDAVDINALETADDLVINGASITLTKDGTLDSIVSDINGTSALQGVVASADEDGNLVLTSNSGADIDLAGTGLPLLPLKEHLP